MSTFYEKKCINTRVVHWLGTIQLQPFLAGLSKRIRDIYVIRINKKGQQQYYTEKWATPADFRNKFTTFVANFSGIVPFPVSHSLRRDFPYCVKSLYSFQFNLFNVQRYNIVIGITFRQRMRPDVCHYQWKKNIPFDNLKNPLYTRFYRNASTS